MNAAEGPRSGSVYLVVLMSLWLVGNIAAALLMSGLAWQLGVADLQAYLEQVRLAETPPADPDPLRVFLGVGMVFNFGLPAVAFALLLGRGNRRELLLWEPPQRSPWQWLLGIGAVSASVWAVMAVYWFNNQIPLPESLARGEEQAGRLSFWLTQADGVSGLVVTMLLLGVLPAVCEELFFRGAMQVSLVRLLKSPHAGIVLTALLFSAMHGQFGGFLPRALLGLILGYTAYWSRSIWLTILMHGVFNGAQVVGAFWARPTMAEALTAQPVPWWQALLSAVATGALLYGVYRNRGASPYKQKEN